MKHLILIFTIVLILSCDRGVTNKKSVNNAAVADMMNKSHVKVDCDTAAWYKNPKDRDRLLVYSEGGDTTYYTKGELKRVLRSYPELNDPNTHESPDEVFARSGMNGELQPCDVNLGDCELCQDDYYILYAHFLKQRNGEAKYINERAQLIELYRHVNSLFGNLRGGGTYFAHQYRRIV